MPAQTVILSPAVPYYVYPPAGYMPPRNMPPRNPYYSPGNLYPAPASTNPYGLPYAHPYSQHPNNPNSPTYPASYAASAGTPPATPNVPSPMGQYSQTMPAPAPYVAGRNPQAPANPMYPGPSAGASGLPLQQMSSQMGYQGMGQSYRYPNVQAPLPVPTQLAKYSASQSTQPLLITLREAVSFSHREWAADMLANIDWRTNPQAVDALVLACRTDPAAPVRQACVRSLATMRANTINVVNTIQALRLDGDMRVQREAEQALAILAPVQQTQAVVPAQR